MVFTKCSWFIANFHCFSQIFFKFSWFSPSYFGFPQVFPVSFKFSTVLPKNSWKIGRFLRTPVLCQSFNHSLPKALPPSRPFVPSFRDWPPVFIVFSKFSLFSPNFPDLPSIFTGFPQIFFQFSLFSPDHSLV